jgi:hypothetical protein
MGEIDQAENAVHHGVPDGDQRVQTAQGKGIHELLEECREIHGIPFSAPIGEKRWLNNDWPVLPTRTMEKTGGA